ncbi:hypothetical protein DF17_33390 [Streptomyces rimosus]|nr:hypothetical protein DF17_33390 [Streptomyces rimosus]
MRGPRPRGPRAVRGLGRADRGRARGADGPGAAPAGAGDGRGRAPEHRPPLKKRFLGYFTRTAQRGRGDPENLTERARPQSPAPAPPSSGAPPPRAGRASPRPPEPAPGPAG